MRTAIIRQKLHQFIETAEEKKVRAIYALFEDEIAQDEWEYTEGAWIDDKAYIAEMDKRFKELESGKVKGLNLDDLATGARLFSEEEIKLFEERSAKRLSGKRKNL